MADTFKSYFSRNLKKVIAKFGDVALLDEIGESNLSSALATKINGKADSSTVTTLSGKVDTLIGSDTGKSARSIAAEELATQLIPQNAAESLDTLQEIAAWIQAHPGDASAMNAAISALQTKVTLGNATTYVAATGTYVDGTTYYTDSTGATEVDTSSLTEGVTDVSSYYVASSGSQYATVKAYVEAYVASQVAGTTGLSDFSATTTGSGNVITAASYNNTTGVTTFTKGVTAITEDDLIDLTTSEIDALFVAETPSSGD